MKIKVKEGMTIAKVRLKYMLYCKVDKVEINMDILKYYKTIYFTYSLNHYLTSHYSFVDVLLNMNLTF